MFEIFGVPSQALFGQLLLGLINGSFYALLSLGLAVIFGMLNIINFTHGAQYMIGAFTALFLLQHAGLGYWSALIIAPILVGLTGVVIERAFLQWLYKLDHLYGLLLTFGLALIIEGVFRNYFGSSGLPYQMPETLTGGQNLGFMFLPNYRARVVVFSAVETLKAPAGTAREWSEPIAFAVMVAVLVIAPFFAYPLFLMQALCFALFACAFNLLIGYVGLLSFGHALYFGWASYLAAHSAKVWGFPPELAIVTGTLTGCALGIVAGSLAIRRQGIYFAMITL